MSEDLQLRRQELEQDRVLREIAIDLQRKELCLRRWTNPLLIALLTVVAGLYGNYIVRERSLDEQSLAQTRFCYDVLSDLILKNPERRRDSAKDLNQLLTFKLINDCEGDLREFADYYSQSAPPVPAAPSEPDRVCEKIVPIRDLGWTSGHKTRFCQARGFDGVHNPFDDYKAGGFCFKGDSQACIAEMTRSR